jgi:hypothetical protein
MIRNALYVHRDPAPMTCVHTYRPKRRWNWRKAAESLLVVLAVAWVVAVLTIMGVMWLG